MGFVPTVEDMNAKLRHEIVSTPRMMRGNLVCIYLQLWMSEDLVRESELQSSWKKQSKC